MGAKAASEAEAAMQQRLAISISELRRSHGGRRVQGAGYRVQGAGQGGRVGSARPPAPATPAMRSSTVGGTHYASASCILYPASASGILYPASASSLMPSPSYPMPPHLPAEYSFPQYEGGQPQYGQQLQYGHHPQYGGQPQYRQSPSHSRHQAQQPPPKLARPQSVGSLPSEGARGPWTHGPMDPRPSETYPLPTHPLRADATSAPELAPGPCPLAPSAVGVVAPRYSPAVRAMFAATHNRAAPPAGRTRARPARRHVSAGDRISASADRVSAAGQLVTWEDGRRDAPQRALNKLYGALIQARVDQLDAS